MRLKTANPPALPVGAPKPPLRRAVEGFGIGLHFLQPIDFYRVSHFGEGAVYTLELAFKMKRGAFLGAIPNPSSSSGTAPWRLLEFYFHSNARKNTPSDRRAENDSADTTRICRLSARFDNTGNRRTMRDAKRRPRI